ncbi:MAG: hypothetical protein ACOYZ6_05765 [Chloroflexota bacterium]
MKKENARTISTPENEFLVRKQELFTMKLLMPAHFKDEWLLFKKNCNKLGLEFEDVLGDLIVQFNNGDVFYNQGK